MTQKHFGPSSDYNPGEYYECIFTYKLADGEQHRLVVETSHKMMKQRIFEALEAMTAQGLPSPSHFNFVKIEDPERIASIIYQETMIE